MTLLPGTKLGRYEIRSKIGEGGMGEVYRAFDPKINREVAIKILPAGMSSDKNRLARFEQEAQAAGGLNHPNILAVYDVDSHNEAPYVVSELLAGEVLRDRLYGGPLSARKAVDYGMQIARGLAAAHEKGIIHRDIKPENIFITADDRVKLLDFGLAKLIGSDDAHQSQTDILTKKLLTNPGVVMGTVGYMSPEQVQGLPVDHRSDIFAFGAVLYEMLAGRATFEGDSAVEKMNAILKHDPANFSETDVSVSPPLERLVLRCLEKKPSDRFQSIGDVGFALEAFTEISGTRQAKASAAMPWFRNRDRLAWAVAAVLAVILAITLIARGYFRTSPALSSPSVYFTVVPPERTEFIKNGDVDFSIAVSPDGLRLALVVVSQGRTQLWIRSLNAVAAQPLVGTENGNNPFWSPDSRFIGFFADGKLKKIDINGGPPQVICNAPSLSGGTWNAEGVILFSKAGEGIYRVAATGSDPIQVSKTDTIRDLYQVWPHFLPDGHHFLFLAGRDEKDASKICVGSLDGGQPQPLLTASSRAIYASPGYLLYVRDAILLAQPFDYTSLQLTGNAVPIAEGMDYFKPTGDADFSVSDNGVLAFKTRAILSRLVWFNRQGEEVGSVGTPRNYAWLRLSGDDRKVAVHIIDPPSGMSNLWIIEFERGTAKRVTLEDEQEIHPLWSRDGRQLVFSIDKRGPPHLFRKTLDDARDPEELMGVTGSPQRPFGWSADGQELLFADSGPATGPDLWILPMNGERKPHPFLQTRFNEGEASVSRDGKWVAYYSNESGRDEVYVSPFQNSDERWQISNSGGRAPRWRGDGKELFYVAADGNLMAVPIKSGASIEAGSPMKLFKITSDPPDRYDVTYDGQRFLVNTKGETSGVSVTLTTNWKASIKR
jgi:serine/threonine protein kinase